MKNILITTTNSIEDAKITKYLGIVSSNMVVGTNIFSDFVASLSDVFGGTSGTYRNQLQRLYKYAVDEITEIANKKRADAVIGLHIDFDELSGKGKSMFMVSIVGTAVNLQFASGASAKLEEKNSVSLDELHLQQHRMKWEKRTPDSDLPTDEDWNFLLSHDVPEVANAVYLAYLKAIANQILYNTESSIKAAEEYFSQLDSETLSGVVYSNYQAKPSVACDIIMRYKLFNAKQILDLFHTEVFPEATRLLLTEKTAYTEDDLSGMQAIIDFLDNLPDKGEIKEVKGLLSSGKVKYVCCCGKANDVEQEFCDDCGLNIKGLNRSHVENIKKFKEKVEVLSQLFAQK